MNLEPWLHLLAALVVVTLVRGVAVFLVTYAVTSLAKNLSSETRHVVWLGVIASFLLIPLAWLLLPAVRLNTWIPIAPAASYRLAAAPVLSRGDYVLLIERAREQSALVSLPRLRLLRGISFAVASAWAIGILALAGRLLLGRWKLRRLVAAARGEARLQAIADTLAREFGLRRRITLRLSPLCRIPFAFGFRRPVVLFPQAAAGWPAGRLRSAFTHELAHIQRQDIIAQTAGYAVCVLFWFIPLLWLAYSAMLREAETCCDQQVINRGFRGPEYAQDIVDLARSCGGRILLPSTSSMIGRKSMLKERVKRVLSLKSGRRPSGIGGSVRVLAICLACVVPILALTAQTRPLLLQPTDPLFGTWVNSAYESASVIRETAAKVVFFADGREQEYLKTADVEPFAAGNINLEVVWIDAEGNHWYKMVWAGDYHPRPQKETRFKWYVLAKVDAASNHLTIIWGQDTYPKDFKDVTPLGVSLEYRRQ